jgi:lysine-N-methylase
VTIRIRPLPVIENWDCHGCSDCCRSPTVLLDKSDLARLREQKWEEHEEFLGRKTVARETLLGGKRVLAKKEDGSCIFLSQAGRCRIHEIHGPEAKPSVCRMYPFQLVPLGGFAYLTVRRGCPSAAADKGRPLGEHLESFKQSGLVDKFALGGAQPPAIIPHQQRSWQDFLIVADTLMRLTTDENLPLVRRLVHGLRFCSLLSNCKIKRVAAESFRELISCLESSAADDVGELFQHRTPPSGSTKALFRQAALHYIRCHPEFPDTHRWRDRWRLFRVSTRFFRGRGDVPAIHPGFEQATFDELEEPLGPLPPDITAPLSRYFETHARSKHYAIAGRRRSLIESYRALVLTYPISLWLLRLATGDRQPTRSDAVDLVVMLERGQGSRSITRSADLMAAGQQLERLAAWYVR